MAGEQLHEVRVSAPGKVILHGEHAVVYGKTALAVALGLRTNIVVKELDSCDKSFININLPSVDLNERMELKLIKEKLFNLAPLAGITAKFSWMEPDKLDHEKHLKNVVDYLHETRPSFAELGGDQQDSLRGLLYILSGILGSAAVPVCGMDISIESQLSAGAGMGSSASFAVCLAGAMIQLIKLKTGTEETEFSTKDKDIISAWAYNCERIMHGSPSGIDNTTCTFGSLVRFKRGAGASTLPLRVPLRVLLVDTRVPRQTSALAAKVAAFRSWNGPAVDSVMDACDHITHAAIQILESLSSDEESTDTNNDQYERLEALWDMNQSLLGALGVSHAALERARRAARRHQLACKLTGAGGGGCALVLVRPDTAPAQVSALTDALEACGCGVTDVRLGGSGVRLH